MPDSTNQSNYQDNQEFNLNIQSVYDTFIKVIDEIRSKVNISANQARLNKLTLQDVLNISSIVKPELTPQESRCHAFYRWIGLPIINLDGSRFYNPGHDIIKDKNRSIKIENKIDIANNLYNPDDKFPFKSLSIIRENYTNNILSIFANNKSINAGTLALLSGANIRSFSSPFKTDDSFDFSVKSQQYQIDTTSLVGKNKVLLENYMDADGNKPNGTNLYTYVSSSSYLLHIIKPFMVDPRIDFSVSPSYNKVAVPFVPDNTYLRVSEGKNAKRPLIEKVITERLTVQNSKDNISYNQEFIESYVENIPAIADDALINKANGSTLSAAEKAQFAYFLDLIKAMMIELVKAQLDIQVAQSKYYWLPIPSISGPEGGCTSHKVFISQTIASSSPNLITPDDKELIKATISATLNSFSTNANNAATDTKDVADLALPGFTTTFSKETSSAFEDNAQKNQTTLNNTRNSVLTKANEALKTIEIIMGEYSGLGLCDIVAILGALYIMPKGNLISLLDIDARQRMNNNLGLSSAETDFLASGSSGQNVVESINVLGSNVKDFYNLMDKIYLDVKENQGNVNF